MSKKKTGLLITAEGVGRVSKDGEVEMKTTNVTIEPVVVEEHDPPEVVYEDRQSRGKSWSGYSRAFSAGWDRMMQRSDDENLPN